MASITLPPSNGSLFLSSPSSSFPNRHHRSATIFKSGWRRNQDTGLVSNRTRGQAFQVLANPNFSTGKGDSNSDVIMVDPLEAKRLAAKKMEAIRAKEKLKRRRKIEAINGAWAMIGLTAGLVIEGQTGKSILDQLAGYLDAVVHFFVR
ncbi:Chlorophyll A-B binding protein [Quillaja saponaria]|uniref:Chlorophyll A-B binding protein n=1 Tax=Quillaja saponaria TaxID=32244 RepID=A0AAD7QDH7_QUISA|nr:Chlorophyll A-B binding protein [Quillaja saponaria]